MTHNSKPILLFDLECDGFAHNCTKIHCLTILDNTTNEIDQYYDDTTFGIPSGSIKDGVDRLAKAGRIVAHNLLGYDLKVLNRLYDYQLGGQAFDDTYILVQYFLSERYHDFSLAGIGRSYGIAKIKNEDWSTLTDNMLERNLVDVRIMKKLYDECQLKRQKSDDEPIKLEYETYSVLVDSGAYWKIDMPYVQDLKRRTEEELQEAAQMLKDLHGGFLSGNKISPLGPPSVTIRPRTAKGLPTAACRKWCEEAKLDINTIHGEFSRLWLHEYNPSSTEQTIKWFLEMGWKPNTFTYQTGPDGKPILDGGRKVIKNVSLSGSAFYHLRKDVKQAFQRYQKLSKIHSTYLTNWIDKAEIDPTDGWHFLRLHADTCGTVTSRWGHKGIANIPRPGSFYGEELRRCFIAGKGKTLIGCDASQLELMIEGHYCAMFDKGARLHILLNGDAHQETADALGIDRSEAKAVNFACLYGAGANRIAEIVGCDIEQAQAMHKQYKETRWELETLKDAIKRDLIGRKQLVVDKYKGGKETLKEGAWIKSLDGRRTPLRSMHACLNSLIQSAGAVMMKRAYVMLAKRLKEENLPARLVILYHDEYTIEADNDPQVVDRVLKLSLECIEEASRYYKLTGQVTGDPKAGQSWYEIH